MSKAPNSATDFVFLCMRDNDWWTFWRIQSEIREKTGRTYSEATISASIRDLRKPEYRRRYSLPIDSKDNVESRRLKTRRGYEYRLITQGEKSGKI